ncbi:hypothetical protein PTSG_06932 [Salpingoeca rosetta]|uniref:BZIP domain-containing protein n=1 Tax=Salpingoeca rosetta (strain ATCC 50818 / BSB-021) TaxID=946362 RepID=F2UF80_SALR5|nr:uncharacterized protein PTSG_06932 [Salpingoeca rosetta]EGD75280.1 hypothetical protein PTSG_06932 [Salpingoeca rosetta]|eukprot:XP_004992333.1 hypothetical protein PTSG_06932 [Salpingoeca rosetta]
MEPPVGLSRGADGGQQADLSHQSNNQQKSAKREQQGPKPARHGAAFPQRAGQSAREQFGVMDGAAATSLSSFLQQQPSLGSILDHLGGGLSQVPLRGGGNALSGALGLPGSSSGLASATRTPEDRLTPGGILSGQQSTGLTLENNSPAPGTAPSVSTPSLLQLFLQQHLQFPCLSNSSNMSMRTPGPAQLQSQQQHQHQNHHQQQHQQQQLPDLQQFHDCAPFQALQQQHDTQQLFASGLPMQWQQQLAASQQLGLDMSQNQQVSFLRPQQQQQQRSQKTPHLFGEASARMPDAGLMRGRSDANTADGGRGRVRVKGSRNAQPSSTRAAHNGGSVSSSTSQRGQSMQRTGSSVGDLSISGGTDLLQATASLASLASLSSMPATKPDNPGKRAKLTNATGGSDPGEQDEEPRSPETEEERRKRRLEKNRQAAKASRMKKKAYVHDLEVRVKQLAQANARLSRDMKQLREQNSKLEKENKELRELAAQQHNKEDDDDVSGK